MRKLDIKLESIGGMGANLIGKILGEMYATKLGGNASNFSSYGSEKTGSPVTAFVRWRDSKEPIREITPITHPDILVLFHHSLLKEKYTLSGITPQTKIIVNSPNTPDELAENFHINNEIFAIDCQALINEHSNTIRINMILLGALLKTINDEEITAATKAFVSELFTTKGEEIEKRNQMAISLGFNNVKSCINHSFSGNFKATSSAFIEDKNTTAYGYANTPIGGIIPSNGSTAKNNLHLSRNGFIPEYHPEKCIHCGLCDTTCPDMVFKFVEGEYKNRKTMVNCGPNYNYCKGCLRCVTICPTNALTAGPDTFHNINMAGSHGADPVITSEAFQSENVAEGGLNE